MTATSHRSPIPSGTQTYSKTRYPTSAPTEIVRAEGCRVYDSQGRDWVDVVCGIGPVILGYGDPQIRAAVDAQLDTGLVSSSLPTGLEAEMANLLLGHHPWAEAVRFSKNGADVTNAAVRLARAVTGRDRIACIGYHGHDDWYIGTQVMRAGVPEVYGRLTRPLPYGHTDTVEIALQSQEVACLIMEPVVSQKPVLPPPGYLEAVRDLCDHYGTLLIFDEMVSGYRAHLGGLHMAYGVTPDLACFGKAIANGWPLAALLGRWDVMERMEKDVFFSTTFGGECVSLAAGIATVKTLEERGVINRLGIMGMILRKYLRRCLKESCSFGEYTVLGYDQRLVLEWNDPDQSSRFTEAMNANGVLYQGYFNLCHALTQDLDAMERVGLAIGLAVKAAAIKAAA